MSTTEDLTAPGYRRAQRAWALSAWANHGYITTVLVGFFPIYFDSYLAADVPGASQTFYLGLTNSLVGLIVMLLAPTLGARADRLAQKKWWLGWFTVLGVIASAMLALFGKGEWPWALVVFALGSIGYFAGSSFQDALLVQVSTPATANRVSAYGFAAGYLGGGLLLLFNALLVMFPHAFHLADKVAATRVAFIDVAVWWALFSLPVFRHVREPAPTAEPAGWAELLATVRRVLGNRNLLSFLLAYWLYIDGIGTLQQMAVDFGAKLGLPAAALLEALLLVQFIAFPSALLFSRLGDRIGERLAIHLGLIVFIGVTLWALVLHSTWQFFAMAALVGMVQGGVQSLSRSLYTRLIPRERAGEYFGFYNMIGKFAAVLGPLVLGVTAKLTGNTRFGIVSLVVFFIGGALLLRRVRVPAASPARS